MVDREGQRYQYRDGLIGQLKRRDRQRYGPVCIAYKTGRQCTRGAKCPFRHEMPKHPNSICRSGLDDPDIVELIAQAGNMGPLEPPEDQSVKTLYIRRLNSSVLEQDIRDHFSPYGEIESIKFFVRRECSCAYLTYTTRLAAEKAMLELSSWTEINGQTLKLLWGPSQDPSNQQGTLAHSGLLPQQQSIGAVISTQEVGASSSHGASSSSSYQMPPHPPPHQEECEEKRRNIG